MSSSAGDVDTRAGGLRAQPGWPAFFLAATLARLASEMFPVAVVLLVLGRTGRIALAGAAVAASTLPGVVTGPVLGAWLDRMAHRRAALASNQVVLGASLLAILAAAGRAPGWALLLLAALAGLTAAGDRRVHQHEHRTVVTSGEGKPREATMTAVHAAVADIAEELASPPVRAALYCRRSAQGGGSVELQERDGRRLAAEKGWTVTAVFKEWVSASEFARKDRKEWARLLQGIEAREFDAVIFYMEDRSARHILFAGELVQACRAAGVTKVLLPSYQYDFSDAEDVARFYGEVLAAQREVAKMSKRMRRVRREERENGMPSPGGKRPFGSQGWRRMRDEAGNWRTEPIVSEAQAARERKLIREAARRILAGDSLRGIVLDWNGKPGSPPRVPTATGGRWGTRTLKQVLLAPRVAGLRGHRGQIVTGDDGQPIRLVADDGQPIEPILPREQWEAVRAILTDPARAIRTVGGTPRHLLTGLAFCGVCGARLQVFRRGGHVTYRCPYPGDGGRCCVQRLAKPVEDLILRAVFRAVENPTWHEAAAERSNDDPARPHYERLAELTAELDVLDRRIGEAELAEELGRRPHPSAATLRRMLAKRETAREHHRAAVTRLQTGRVVAAVPRNLRQLWPSYSVDRQRAILAAMIERIEIDRQRPLGPGGFDPEAIRVIRRG
jgi:DNA invertase Pin-like site-specific DNA recombinase